MIIGVIILFIGASIIPMTFGKNIEPPKYYPTVINFLHWEEVYFIFSPPEEKGEWYHPSTFAVQRKNCWPCFLLCRDSSLYWEVDCEFQVNTTVDDDFIGFTFGYNNKEHFCTIDWVANHDYNRSWDGFTIREFNTTNSLNLTKGDFKSRTSTNNMKVLDRLHEVPGNNVLSWKPFIWYKFHLVYKKGSYSITISNNTHTLYSAQGNIKWNGSIPCRFGLYVCSQQSTEYNNAFVKNVIKGLTNVEKTEYNPVIKTMPRNKPLSFNLNRLERLFESFPNAFPILRNILGL